jgi:hypothetical protein
MNKLAETIDDALRDGRLAAELRPPSAAPAESREQD